MDLGVLTLVLVGSLLILLFSGIPVAFALLVSGVLAFALGGGAQSLQFLGVVFWNQSFSFEFLAAPLFVYMGFLLEKAQLITALFRAINLWLGRFPGSLGVVALGASTLFAAMSGSGGAAAATLGTVMAPQARRAGFDKVLMLGVLCGGASLAALIPPSLAFIIYSALTDAPLSRLFAAGLVPGMLMAGVMILYVIVVCLLRPQLAPRSQERFTWNECFASLWVFAVIGFVIFIVLGGIFLGWYTASESAALGVVVATLILAIHHRFNLRAIMVAMVEGSRGAAIVAIFIMALLICGTVYSAVLNFLGVPQLVTTGIQSAGLGKLEFVLILSFILLVMGCFIDAPTIQVLTIPFVLPLLAPLEIDLIWFGVYIVFWIEIGSFTPPFGLFLFVLQGVMKVNYWDAVVGAAPFIPIWILGVVLIYVFPELVFWLPSKLF
jgi:tripartite ATP-independent transporter DctM subunit